jgi:hypothetical protein
MTSAAIQVAEAIAHRTSTDHLMSEARP